MEIEIVSSKRSALPLQSLKAGEVGIIDSPSIALMDKSLMSYQKGDVVTATVYHVVNLTALKENRTYMVTVQSSLHTDGVTYFPCQNLKVTVTR